MGSFIDTAHCRWPGWLSRTAKAGPTCSISCKGCSPDNAAYYRFFGRLKTKMFYPGNGKSTSIEQFTQALDLYIRWYNEKRIKISPNALSPVEYRKNLVSQHNQSKKSAAPPVAHF